MANFEAMLAAVTARGPRCYDCGGWTFRPVPVKQRRPMAQVQYDTPGHQRPATVRPYYPRGTVFLCGVCIAKLEAVLTSVVSECRQVTVTRGGVTIRVPLASVLGEVR